MQSFTEFFDQYLVEKIGLDRVRQVKKAFNKSAKRNNTAKFKPGTFGFDIEFNYLLEPEIEKDWIAYMQKKRQWIDKFHDWVFEKHDVEEPTSLEDWEAENPMPEKVGEIARPDPDRYENDVDDGALYRQHLDAWEAHRETYEEYIDAYDTWESEKEDVEEAMDHWNSNLETWWKEYAEETINEAYNHIDVDTTESRLEYYGSVLDDLGETWQMDDDHSNFKEDWCLSVDQTAGNPPEVASRILTYKDMGLVKEFLTELRHEKTSNGTSAHIHIGLPDKFDAFSVLTLFQLVDEKYIKNRLPTRMFTSFAQFANVTVKKIHDIVVPLIESKSNLWYRTNNRTNVKALIDEDTKKQNERIHVTIHFDENGILEDDKKQWAQLKDQIKDKTIKITGKRRHNQSQGKYILMISYVYLKESKGPFTFEKIPLERTEGDAVVLNENIIDYILERITEKHSGINISYYKGRNVIEFRYLSSDILGDIDEFLEFINYFLFVPHVAQRAKRVKLGSMELRKLDNKKVQIKIS